tara:strand:- start:533 stop:1636 length:1104 start_codon:yes stop_codon:yes gene_type:complete
MWKKYQTIYYKLYNVTKPIILFDFDETLVYLRTSNPKPLVINKLREMSSKYDFIVISNQMGIQKKKTTNEKIQTLMDDFQTVLGIDICIGFCYATCDDIFRKPMVGMYNFISKKTKSKSKIMYYCGDACGRPGDFSCSDLFFANNCEIPFKTPELVFQNINNLDKVMTKKSKKYILYKDDIWNNGLIQNHRNILPISNKINIAFEKNKKHLIIMVGGQGCGKSSLSKCLHNNYGFEIINRDNLKTDKKMISEFKKYIKNNEVSGIIIDNTNPTKEKREKWKILLKDNCNNFNDWKINIIYFNISRLKSLHLVRYRMFFGYTKIPNIAVNIFYKKLEIPQINGDEGNVIVINNALSGKSFNHNLRFGF